MLIFQEKGTQTAALFSVTEGPGPQGLNTWGLVFPSQAPRLGHPLRDVQGGSMTKRHSSCFLKAEDTSRAATMIPAPAKAHPDFFLPSPVQPCPSLPIGIWNVETIEAECNHCLQKKKNGTRFIYWKVTEEYEFYTPFKMLFISLSLGAQSTSNFTHSYNSLPNSSCCSSGVPRNQVSLCLPLLRRRQGQRRLRASAHEALLPAPPPVPEVQASVPKTGWAQVGPRGARGTRP